MGQQYRKPDGEHQLVALGRVLQTLREEENADVLIETTLDYLQTEFNYRLVWIGLYDRLEHRLLGKGGVTPTGNTKFLKQRFNLNPGDLLEQVVIQQRPVGIPDLQQEVRAGEWRRAARECGIQGTLLFPLRCKDRCYGVALLGSHLWGVSSRPGEKAQLSLLLGGLAAALHQIEVAWQRSATKRPDQPLFQVLDELMQVPTLDLRLEAIVKMTQQFVTPTRTNLYWYSPERRYFWHRFGNQQRLWRLSGARGSAAGLTVAEANDFYQALASGQLVTIGAGKSLLKSESTERLLKRLRTRSLLAAPIQSQGELLGFLAVEDSKARIWEEAERSYVRATAQLVALVVGHEELEATLTQTQKDTHFVAEVAQALSHPDDVELALKNMAGLLCKRLGADRVLVLQETERGEFAPIFQQQPHNRRPLHAPLEPLSQSSQQLLDGANVVTVEDLDEDVSLFQWRETLLQLGVRSLLAGKVSQGSQTQGLSVLLVACGTARTWNALERRLIDNVAQQLNLLLTLGSYSERARLTASAHDTLQAGLSVLSQASQDPVQFERAWLDYLANLLDCPLVVLLSWTPHSPNATIAATVTTDPRFALPPDLAIPIATTPLIQDALATRHFLCRPIAECEAAIRKGFGNPSIGQLLAIALNTGTTATTGMLLLADCEERQWPSHLLPPLEILTEQFAWFRHYRYHLSHHQGEGADLQTLNWYKHRCLDILHQTVRESIRMLLDIETRATLADEAEASSHPRRSQAPARGDIPLRQTRRQQLLHQLEQTLSVLAPVLTEEQWELTVNRRPLTLASLLKRSLRRVEPIYNQRRVMLKVHNPRLLSVYGDRIKLECVLFELLVTACVRAQPGGWIHLWCTPLSPELQETIPPLDASPSFLELSIAENERLDECFEALADSSLVAPPSLNLQVCQQVLRSWGGDLQFYQLPAAHYFSRLLLPLAK